MSIKVMSEVWEYAPLVGTDLLILLALADMANDDRECWPGMKHLSHKARVSVRQVGNILEDLQNQGIITIAARLNPTGGNSSNLYRVNEVRSWDVLTAYEDTNRDVPQYTPPLSDSTSPDVPQYIPPTSTVGEETEQNLNSESSLKQKGKNTRASATPSKAGNAKKDNPLSSKDVPELTAIIKGYIDGLSIPPTTNQYGNKTNRGAAACIAAAGYTPEQVQTYTAHVCLDNYWKGRKVPLTYIAENIAAHYAAHKPKPVIPIPEGSYDPALDDGTPATLEQIRQAKEMFAELIRSKSGNGSQQSTR